MEWGGTEFKELKLGDKRLDARLKKIADRLYKTPMSSINQACGSWHDTKAAYRLFDNDKMDYQKILDEHRKRTAERIKEHHKIIAIQDTTFFNYHKHESKEGLGLIHSNERPIRGLLAHNTLISTLAGVPLGLFDQKIFARKTHPTKPKWYEREIEEKESFRWVEALDVLKENLPRQVECTVVADREADISEFIYGCIERNLDVVVRSQLNRIVGEKKKRWDREPNEHLIDFLEKCPVEATSIIEVNDQQHKGKKRQAQVEIKYTSVQIPLPWRIETSYKEQTLMDLFVVDVKEMNPPENTQAVHWRLLTSLLVESLKQALEVIEIYKKRWVIETYHKVIKSGCGVEDCRLETFARMQRFITLMSIVAWRLHWITEKAKVSPNDSCEVAFEKNEWLALWRFAKKNKTAPKKPPKLSECVHWLAQLGGFMNRTNDGDPGVTTIWRGWKSLQAHMLLSCG